MRRKGEDLGASGQISKPEINKLINLLDHLIFGTPLTDDKENLESEARVAAAKEKQEK
jgi:two-component system chemotaxis response regulator CheV